MKKSVLIMLCLIIALGVFLRANQFLSSPPALFIDESDIGYQAYSLLKTGKDYFGNSWPIHPESFADKRPFLYMFLVIPSIYLFGLTNFAVRFPSLLLGIMTIPLIFWLTRNLFPNWPEKEKNLLGLSTTLILAILPWHIHYSRIGFELTTLLFFTILGLGFFIKWSNSQNYLYLLLSIPLLLLVPYVYATGKLFIPFLVLSLLILAKDKIFHLSKKKVFLAFLIGCLAFLPMGKDIISGSGSARFAVLSVFADQNSLSDYLHYQWLLGYNQTSIFGLIKPTSIGKIIFNPAIHITYQVLTTLLTTYSPQFLTFSGDPNPRHTIPNSGVAGIVISFLFLFGLIILILKQKGFSKYLLLILLLLAPLPATITREGQYHATRLFLTILPLTIVAGLGFYYLFFKTKLPKIYLLIFILILSWEIARDQYIRVYVYPFTSLNQLNWGWQENVTKTYQLAKNYDAVIIDSWDGAPIQTYFAFYHQVDPQIFQQYVKNSQTKLEGLDLYLKSYFADNIYFSSFGPDPLNYPLKTKILAVVPAIKIGENNFQNIEVVEIVKNPVGLPAFYFISNKHVSKSLSQ